MGIPLTELRQITRVLQQSAETRMRAIREKISLTSTLCNTVELEIKFGNFNRAQDLLFKLDSVLNGLTSHIDDPVHVSDQTLREGFLGQLAQLRQRVSLMRSDIEQAQSGLPL